MPRKSWRSATRRRSRVRQALSDRFRVPNIRTRATGSFAFIIKPWPLGRFRRLFAFSVFYGQEQYGPQGSLSRTARLPTFAGGRDVYWRRTAPPVPGLRISSSSFPPPPSRSQGENQWHYQVRSSDNEAHPR